MIEFSGKVSLAYTAYNLSQKLRCISFWKKACYCYVPFYDLTSFIKKNVNQYLITEKGNMSPICVFVSSLRL